MLKPPTLREEIRTFGRVERRPATTRDRVVAAALLGAVIIATIALVRYNPAEIEQLPACPTYASLGLYCPGCGSTRAVHHLLHARIGAAWRHNPALVLVGVPFLALMLVQIGGVLAKKTHVGLRGSGRLGIALAVALLAYGVVRNIPLAILDSLRPPGA